MGELEIEHTRRVQELSAVSISLIAFGCVFGGALLGAARIAMLDRLLASYGPEASGRLGQ